MKNQKGVILIITFLITTIIIAIALGVNAILFDRIKLIGDIAKSVPAYYIAYGGVEKAEYYYKTSGICSICSTCPNHITNPLGDPATWCEDCTATPLSVGGCNPATCGNGSGCKIGYYATWAGKKNTVSAIVTCPNFNISSLGFYQGIARGVLINKVDDLSGLNHCTYTP